MEPKVADVIKRIWDKKECELRASLAQETYFVGQDASPEAADQDKESGSSGSSRWTVVSHDMQIVKDTVLKLAEAHNELVVAFNESRNDDKFAGPE